MSNYSQPRGAACRSNGNQQPYNRVNSLKLGGARASQHSNCYVHPRDRLNSQDYELGASQLLQMNMSDGSDDKIERRWNSDDNDDDVLSQDQSSQGDDDCNSTCLFTCRCGTAENRDDCDSNLLVIKRKYFKIKEQAEKYASSAKDMDARMKVQSKKFQAMLDQQDKQIQDLRRRLEQVTGITELMQLPDNKQAIEA